MMTLEERIARLEHIEAIKQLKTVYCEHCDTGYQPDKLGPLFTEDAVWDGGSLGRFVGNAAIREFFSGISGGFAFAAHLVMNPRITLTSPTTATGVWRLLEPVKFVADGKAESRLLLARYDDEYRLVDGEWKISSLRLHLNFFENLTDGWGPNPVA